MGLLREYEFDAIVLCGGSPCKQLSRAGCSKKGLYGKDSKLFFEFVRFSRILQAYCSSTDTRLWHIFENVVPSRTADILVMNEALGLGTPILFDSAEISWIRRRRLIWTDASLPPWMPIYITPVNLNGPPYRTLKVQHSCRCLPMLGSIFRGRTLTSTSYSDWYI